MEGVGDRSGGSEKEQDKEREAGRKRKRSRGRGPDGGGGRRARGHFWKKEAAVETREKGGYGVGGRERPEKGGKREKQSLISGKRCTNSKAPRELSFRSERAFTSHLAAIRFLPE